MDTTTAPRCTLHRTTARRWRLVLPDGTTADTSRGTPPRGACLCYAAGTWRLVRWARTPGPAHAPHTTHTVVLPGRGPAPGGRVHATAQATALGRAWGPAGMLPCVPPGVLDGWDRVHGDTGDIATGSTPRRVGRRVAWVAAHPAATRAAGRACWHHAPQRTPGRTCPRTAAAVRAAAQHTTSGRAHAARGWVPPAGQARRPYVRPVYQALGWDALPMVLWPTRHACAAVSRAVAAAAARGRATRARDVQPV